MKNTIKQTQHTSEDTPIRILLKVDRLKDAEKKKHKKKFANLDPFYQQPWYDRVIQWMSLKPEKHEIFKQIKPDQQERVFKILAAGMWSKNIPVDVAGMTAVKTENPDATGFISTGCEGGVVIVEKLPLGTNVCE